LDEREELEPYIMLILHDPNETPHGPAEIVDIFTHKLSIQELAVFVGITAAQSVNRPDSESSRRKRKN
jgi:hypothetical protein